MIEIKILRSDPRFPLGAGIVYYHNGKPESLHITRTKANEISPNVIAHEIGHIKQNKIRPINFPSLGTDAGYTLALEADAWRFVQNVCPNFDAAYALKCLHAYANAFGIVI